MNNKDRVKWYSQKQQKKHKLYDTIRVFTKEIAICYVLTVRFLSVKAKVELVNITVAVWW